MSETHRELALRGEVVRVTQGRLLEMQEQAIHFEGITADPVYHWHWAAVVNELLALRKIVGKLAAVRGWTKDEVEKGEDQGHTCFASDQAREISRLQTVIANAARILKEPARNPNCPWCSHALIVLTASDAGEKQCL